MRITGIMSGMDTETMIKDLMKAESLKMDALEQQKKLAEWEKESYQDISKMLREFRDTYMDILTPATNFRSPSMFANFSSSVMAGGAETSAVSVTGSATATDLTHTISEISQLATADKYASISPVKSTIDGDAIDLSAINDSINAGNDTFSFSFDGVTKAIQLDNGADAAVYADEGALLLDLQDKLDAAFGSDKITASFEGTSLKFSSPESGHQMQVFSSDANILGNLGFETGDASFVKTSETLESAFGIAAGPVAVEINGVTDFGIESTDTVKEMMDKINNSDAGVTISYSSLSGKFELTANDTGAINKIGFGGSNTFLNDNLKINTSAVDTPNDGYNLDDGYEAATDAQFTLDGVTTSRSSNNFTIDGLTYTLNSTHDVADGPIDISLSRNTEELKENIGGFVEKFNEIIKTVNESLNEKRNYDFKPLTDEQRESMSEDDIELWNEKAKSGILRGSNELQTFANNLRRLVYEPVEGVDITLRDIGITTSTNYKDNGKLVVDEAKLESALQNNFDKVVDLFTKTSEIGYEDTANRSQRYNESGFSNRLYDLVQDNVRNTRDANGKRGVLIEKAGFEGELSDLQNTIQTRIGGFDDRISDMLDYLNSREEYYYQMFARMESALAEMDSQGQWLQSQLGGM